MGSFWNAALATFCYAQSLLALEMLPEKYLVSYGDPEAPIKIVEYFSFQCPYCISLFRKDFKNIEKHFIDTKKVHWTFHPVPTDVVTVQGMVCLANLEQAHKKLYLETLLSEAECDNPIFISMIMSKVMEILKKPIPNLQDEDFLQKTDAFMDAFAFFSQKEKILAVPTVEVSSKLFPKEVPDFDFIKTIVENR